MQFWSEEGGQRLSHPLREGSSVIGRHPSCHVVIPGRNVSKRHLQCVLENDVVTITDLGSSNGTTVNGSPVTSCVLKDGDVVELGGYRLVFEVGAGGAPAGVPGGAPAAAPEAASYAAPASFDYEPVDAGPAPGPGPADAAPASGAGPPLQAEPLFEKAPADDDTPADGAFVPQAYAPQSLQPQVVARDGKMYLRDPRTSREVEIVPRKEGGPADLSGYYAEKEAAEKRKNNYLIGAAIGVGLLLIIALALPGSQDDDAVAKKPKQFSTGEYGTRTDKGLDLMQESDFDGALALLDEAHGEYPKYRIAAALAEIAKKWQESGETIDEFNWVPLEPDLRSLVESNWRTTKVESFAKGRLQWIYKTKRHRQTGKEAVRLLNARQFEDALKTFDEIPAGSIARKEYAEKRAETVLACYDNRMKKGKAALRRKEWDEAAREFEAAKQFADVRQTREANRYVKEAERLKKTEADEAERRRVERERLAAIRKREQKILGDANILMREDTPASLRAALKILAKLDKGSPRAGEADALKERIQTRLVEIETRSERDKWTKLAKDYYKAGRGEEAKKVIDQHKLTELGMLKTRVDTITQLFKQAQNAVVAKEYELARAKWTEILAAEPNTTNEYNRRAASKIDEMKRNAKDIAVEYNKLADEALQNGKPRLARKLYLKAMTWDPRATIGKNGLEGLDHLAKTTYNKARDLRYNNRIEEAAELFRKVREYVEEGSKYHNDATRHLRELKALHPDS